MTKSTKPPRRRAGSKSRSLVPVAPRPAAIALPERLMFGDHAIEPEQVAQIPERRPHGEGPWRDEPDRIAWRDPATGYSCLILRQIDGTLSGYVAVARSHPLWCYERDAIPADLGISPHRGLDYSALCDNSGRPMLRICHVHHAVGSRLHVSAKQDSEASSGSDAWWFGFDTDKPGDFLPRDYTRNDRNREAGPKIYRDLAYVAGEVVDLAAKLKALEDRPTSGDGDAASGAGVPLILDGNPKALLPRKRGRP